MGIEIERKFLVNKDSYRYISQSKPDFYIQSYIHIDNTKNIRVRIINEKEAYITLKYKTDNFMIRNEFEYSIPLIDALEIHRHCKYCIKKNRYTVIYKDNVWYIDEYLDDCLNELTVAEIELNNIDQIFEIPEWIGKEISNEKMYNNIELAKKVYRHKTTSK